MTTSDNDFSVDKIKQEYILIGNSNFYKIYDEFNWDCNHSNYKDFGASCLNGTSDSWTQFSEVNKILKNLYSNLYRVYDIVEEYSNDYFEDNDDEIKKMGFIYLKYWLYDQIFNKNFNDSKIEELYQGWNKYIFNKFKNKPSKPYVFNSLKKDEINKIRKIYAFSTLLYQNVNKFETNYNNNCKYMDYFGEGLDEFVSSINKCSSEEPTDNYCKEFKEFLSKCKDKDFNTGISIYPENKGYINDGISEYLLTVDEYENKSLYIYVKDKKMLNFLKTSKFISSQNRTTIAATSVVGSAIGLSTIFYYFYKFTPFGSTLRKRKRKNILNIDGKAHESLLYTSHNEQTPFENRKYNVAYHSFSDT
ncbi:hypothetical protein PVBG_05590 [Plasmodium vivax Brazil I]|uniref:VIR protein n=1 Tax=Plasmodium vivax (strain Brazil I) TaxID=1033975 RepID=A0A0J9VBF7_PLAV1|nr:hypothetical protein PVBG_05590 [Plasmodium vivax Brazil I]